jgi:hypothetical protein
MRIVNTTGSFASTNYAETNYSLGETEDYCFTVSPCVAPMISTQPTSFTQCFNGTQSLSVVASGSSLTYQWFSNTTNSNAGGTNLGSGNGAQTTTYTPPSNAAGTVYYYVVVQSGSCSVTSNAVAVTVLLPFTPGTVQGITTGSGPSNLVIYQVYGAGGNSGATYTNDFVSLYNPTSSAVNLSGWSLQYASATSTSTTLSGVSTIINLSGSIASGGYYLISLNSSGSNGSILPTSNASNTSIAMSANNGKVYLCNTTAGVVIGSNGCSSSTNIVDFVGYGTANCSEGSAAAPSPSNTTWITRAQNGCQDTQVNSADFSAGTATVRNSASPTNFCTTTTNTQTICAGQTASSITATAASGANGSFSYQWYSQAGNVSCPTGSSTVGWTPLTGETNLTLSPGAVSATTTYALFVTATGANNCGGAWASNCRVVIVNPTPVISNMTTSVCSPTAFSVTPTNGTNGTVPAGTSYSWAAPSVPGITGTAAGTNASSISGTLTNTTNAPITVSYTVTPVAGSCTGTTFTVSVTMNPRPSLNNATISACSPDPFSHTPTGTIVPTGTTYSWSAPTGSNFTGGAAGTGASTVDGALTLSSGSSATAVYTVTPSFGTCTGNTFTLTVGLSSCAPPIPFAACNLVVYEVGNGTALDNNAFPVSIKEITPNGVIAQTISNAFVGGNLLTQNGAATSVGLLNSYNGFLSVPGYSVAVGTALNTTSPTSSDLINKVNSILDVNGVVQSYTSFPTIAPIPFSGDHLRGTLPISATNFYATGAGGNQGVYYYNGSSFNQLVSANARGLEIFNNQLYYSSSSNVFQVGTGLPTSGTQTTNGLLTTYSNSGIYDFSISPDGCTMYVADNGSNSSYRGVCKYRLENGAWTRKYNYLAYGIGLVVDYSGSQDIIYVTTATGSSNTPNKIEKIIDNPSGNNFTVVTTGWPITAASNYRFAGIDFTPNSTASISIPDLAAQSFNVCQNGTAQTLSVNGTSLDPLTYQWYSNSNNDFCGASEIPGATSNSYTPPISSQGTTYYFLLVKGVCSNYLRSTMATVVVNPNPTPTISGNIPLCVGSNLTLSTIPYGQNYIWSPFGQTTQAITVNSTGTYGVTVTDSNGCNGSASVVVNAATNATINTITSP